MSKCFFFTTDRYIPDMIEMLAAQEIFHKFYPLFLTASVCIYIYIHVHNMFGGCTIFYLFQLSVIFFSGTLPSSASVGRFIALLGQVNIQTYKSRHEYFHVGKHPLSTDYLWPFYLYVCRDFFPRKETTPLHHMWR